MMQSSWRGRNMDGLANVHVLCWRQHCTGLIDGDTGAMKQNSWAQWWCFGDGLDYAMLYASVPEIILASSVYMAYQTIKVCELVYVGKHSAWFWFVSPFDGPGAPLPSDLLMYLPLLSKLLWGNWRHLCWVLLHLLRKMMPKLVLFKLYICDGVIKQFKKEMLQLQWKFPLA